MNSDNEQADAGDNNHFVLEQDDLEELCSQTELPEEPFQWIKVLTEAVVTLIMSFLIFYFILEVNEVSNETDFDNYRKLNNYVETVYLLVAFTAIIVHLDRFRWDQNSFYPLPFDNYPMMVAMILCALIDMAYYFTNYLSIFTKSFDCSRFLATSSELLFVVSILPFVVVCVCNNVRSLNPVLDQRAKITLLLAMGGCVLIFMRKVSLKIEKDTVKHVNQSSSQDNSWVFVHSATSTAENVLELVDITYVLIGLIFLIDPLRYLNVKTGEEDENFDSTTQIPSISVRQSLSLMRFRWLTFVLSTILVSTLLLFSYMITSILENPLPQDFQIYGLVAYLSLTILTYIIGIFYAAMYYVYDIKEWPKKDTPYTRNDGHFNKITSSSQIIYSASMILSMIYQYKIAGSTLEQRNITLLLVEMFDFLFLSVQVLVQAACIHSAIQRQTKRNGMTTWRSRLFPPIALAFLNFGYMIISVVYSQNSIFISVLETSPGNSLVYVVIKDVALPITILNRLHGMAFFIHLSFQQWQG